MSETAPQVAAPYQIDPLIKPGANLSVWVWLLLLGVPALLLMLIYAKVEDRQAAPMTRPAAVAEPHPAQQLPANR